MSTPSPSAGRIAAQLAALSALGPFCIDAYLPSMQEIASAMGVPLLGVQATLTAYMVPFAFMSLWHGAFSDTWGRRRVVLLGLVAFFLASLGCAFAPTLEWLIGFRILQGTTAGVGMVVGRAIVRDLYEGPEAQRLMALVAIIFAIAPAVAPVVGGWLHHWFGWRAVFGFMAVYTVVLTFYIYKKLPETLALSKRQPFHPGYLLRAYFETLSNPVFLTVCLAGTMTFAGLFLYVVSAPVFLMQHLQVSETGFLWLFGPFTVGIVVGNALFSRLAGRLSIRRTAFLGAAIMSFSCLFNVGLNLLSRAQLPWAILPLFFYMVGMSLTLPSMTLKALDCYPQRRGLAASCQSFLQNGGNALLSALAPLFWASSLSLSLTQAVFALLCLGALLGLRLLRRAPAAH